MGDPPSAGVTIGPPSPWHSTVGLTLEPGLTVLAPGVAYTDHRSEYVVRTLLMRGHDAVTDGRSAPAKTFTLIDTDLQARWNSRFLKFFVEHLEVPVTMTRALDDTLTIGIGLGDTWKTTLLRNQLRLFLKAAVAMAYQPASQQIIGNNSRALAEPGHFLHVMPALTQGGGVDFGPIRFAIEQTQRMFIPLLTSTDDIADYTIASFLFVNEVEGRLGIVAPILSLDFLSRYQLGMDPLGTPNHNAELGAQLGVQIPVGSWEVGSQLFYLVGLRRDLHAGDAMPIGRLHQLNVGIGVGNAQWFFDVGADAVFRDADAGLGIAQERGTTIGAGVQYLTGPMQIDLRGSSDLNGVWSITVAVSHVPPATVAGRLTNARVRRRGAEHPAATPNPGPQNPAWVVPAYALNTFWNSPKAGVSKARRVFIDEQILDETLVRTDLDLAKKMDGVRNAADANHLTMMERLYALSTGAQKLFADPNRYHVKTGELYDYFRSYATDPLQFVVDFLKASGYPAERIRSTTVQATEGTSRRVFVQLNDGQWMVFDKFQMFGPFPADSYLHATRLYSPYAVVTGDDHERTYSPQWQHWYQSVLRGTMATPQR